MTLIIRVRVTPLERRYAYVDNANSLLIWRGGPRNRGVNPPRWSYHMSEAPWRAQKWKERDMGMMQRRDTSRRPTRREGKESSFSSARDSGTNSFKSLRDGLIFRFLIASPVKPWLWSLLSVYDGLATAKLYLLITNRKEVCISV